ncbi:MAG: hypothetical protein ACHQ1H_13600 [Nitrososphaerales archaeon]
MTMQDDLSKFTGNRVTNPYEQYNLLENPFPTYGDSRADVCTDQDEIKQKFIEILQNFGVGAKRLRIDGRSGAGKTNILRYFATLTEEARLGGLIGNLYPVYVSEPGDNYFAIHKQIVDQLNERLIGDLIAQLKSNPATFERLEQIVPAIELVRAFRNLAQPNTLFDPFEERRRDIILRWLKGNKLSTKDKKLFEIELPEIGSASLAIRFLEGLLQIFSQLELCKGIVVLFDEFEEIFEGPRTQHSKYAQDLRHLLDALEKSVFFVIATVPEPKDLAQYPPIIRRLGDPSFLRPIDSIDLAITYAQHYMIAGRKRYFKEKSQAAGEDNQDTLFPLTTQDIAGIFQPLDDETNQTGLAVLPGYFLPRVHDRLKTIVEGLNAPSSDA